MTLLSQYKITKNLSEVPRDTGIITSFVYEGLVVSYSVWLDQGGNLVLPDGGTLSIREGIEYAYIEKKPKKYEVVVDFGSLYFEIEAKSEKEATAKVESKLAGLNSHECWVGDIQELE